MVAKIIPEGAVVAVPFLLRRQTQYNSMDLLLPTAEMAIAMPTLMVRKDSAATEVVGQLDW